MEFVSKERNLLVRYFGWPIFQVFLNLIFHLIPFILMNIYGGVNDDKKDLGSIGKITIRYYTGETPFFLLKKIKTQKIQNFFFLIAWGLMIEYLYFLVSIIWDILPENVESIRNFKKKYYNVKERFFFIFFAVGKTQIKENILLIRNFFDTGSVFGIGGLIGASLIGAIGGNHSKFDLSSWFTPLGIIHFTGALFAFTEMLFVPHRKSHLKIFWVDLTIILLVSGGFMVWDSIQKNLTGKKKKKK